MMIPSILTMAWRPFLGPMEMFHTHWLWLLPPLILAICIVYKTLKGPSIDQITYQSLRLWVYIQGLMAMIALALWALVEMA